VPALSTRPWRLPSVARRRHLTSAGLLIGKQSPRHQRRERARGGRSLTNPPGDERPAARLMHGGEAPDGAGRVPPPGGREPQRDCHREGPRQGAAGRRPERWKTAAGGRGWIWMWMGGCVPADLARVGGRGLSCMARRRESPTRLVRAGGAMSRGGGGGAPDGGGVRASASNRDDFLESWCSGVRHQRRPGVGPSGHSLCRFWRGGIGGLGGPAAAQG